MLCFHCEQAARGVCRFCGRGLCKDHMKKRMPFIITIYVGEHNTPKAIVVRDALWCNVCRPEPEPVEMPEIY
jgi:hypothetical protein